MHPNKVFLCLIGLTILGTEVGAIEEGPCTGTKADLHCCSNTNPCQERQGDCDMDSHCAGTLICGKGNCNDFNPQAISFADCCVKPPGCNGDDDGIPCCDDGFILGDNDNGAEEMFIQAGDYKSSCLDSCKSLYKNSIGITESLKQTYSSGNGKNKNKCWCEFGNVKLDATNENYQTCVFAVPGSVVSPVAEPLKRPTGLGQGYYLIKSLGGAAQHQPSRMGRYFHNGDIVEGYPVYEKDGQYLYVNPNGQWMVGSNTSSKVGGLYHRDRQPTPNNPPLVGWRYANDGAFHEDNTLTVTHIDGDKQPPVPTTSTTSTTTAAGEVHLGVGASHEFFYNLGLMSHNGNARDYTTYTGGDPGCCQKCDKRFGPGGTDLYNYKFDQKYNHKLCECFSFRGPSTPERRTRVWSKRSGTTIGYCGNNSTFVDQVDGTFGDDRSFYFRSVDQLGSIWFRPNPEGIPSTSDLCCEECSNKFPESQMFTFGRVGDNYCYCYKEIPGKRPETFGEGTYNGFCGNE